MTGPRQGSKPKPIKCPYCGGIFYGSSPFRRHLPACPQYSGRTASTAR